MATKVIPAQKNVVRLQKGAAGARAGKRAAGGGEGSASAEASAEGEGKQAAQPEGGGAVVGAPNGDTSFDVLAARRSFEAVRGALDSFDEDEVLRIRVDMQRAAAVVLVIARRDLTPARRTVFEAFAQQGNYDLATLEGLPALAEATWYVRRQQSMALYDASTAAIRPEDSAAAYETRARMMLVVGHWVGDRRDIATRLKQLREGSGYQDLANDLQTLAELYARDDVRSHIEHDRKHYRATDAVDAIRYAALLMTALGPAGEGEAERLTGLAQRSATLLLRAYEEHRACGQFLFRKAEDVSTTYPSLFSAARSARRKRPSDEPPDGEPVVEEPVVDEEPDGEGPA